MKCECADLRAKTGEWWDCDICAAQAIGPKAERSELPPHVTKNWDEDWNPVCIPDCPRCLGEKIEKTEPKAEPPRETFALLPAAEVEELKSQLRDALANNRDLRRTISELDSELAQSRQLVEEWKSLYSGVVHMHNQSRQQIHERELAFRAVQESRLEEAAAYKQHRQEMCGKLEELKQAITDIQSCVNDASYPNIPDGTRYVNMDNAKLYIRKALEVLAAIPKEESNGK